MTVEQLARSENLHLTPNLGPRSIELLRETYPLSEPEKGRKIVQIAVRGFANGPGDIVYALCDDGTLWVSSTEVDDGKWIMSDRIPP